MILLRARMTPHHTPTVTCECAVPSEILTISLGTYHGNPELDTAQR
jgi:hypothetical protein